MSCESLSPEHLRLKVQPAALGFSDTSELLDQPLPWIGQAPAEAAARFGLQLDQPDYNLFVLGHVGCGRTTLMRQMLAQHATGCPVPPDLCYVHNFEAPERPSALRLNAGEGRLLRQQMAQWIRRLASDIAARLAEPAVKAECERIEQAYKREEDKAYAELSAYAEARSFSLMREQGHMVFTYRDAQGEPLTAGQAMALPHEKRAEIDAAEAALRGEIDRFLEKTRSMEHVMNEGLAALHRQVVKPLVEQGLAAVRLALSPNSQDVGKLGLHLQRVGQEVLDNLALFQPKEDEEAVRREALDEWLSLLQVHLVVDNQALRGAPVIQEDNPVFRQLFGSIEYDSGGDMLVTDFSHIRAGSLLKAHGGFLMLHLRDLLADPPVWEKLRRFLRSGRLQIEEPGMMYAPIAAVSLEPDPVDVKVKIVLIASVDEFYAVQEGDPEFMRRFRCKVEFVESFLATAESRQATAVLVSKICRENGLPHLDAQAVAALIEETHREAGDQTRQCAVFSRVETWVIESAAMARLRGAEKVQWCDVQSALRARRQRHDHAERRLQEEIAEGDRLLEAVDETLTIGRATGLHVHISHHKSAGRKNWGKVAQSLALVDKAKAAGQKVTLDVYPYTAGSGRMIEYFKLDRIDRDLVSAIMRGHNIVPIATELMRQRTGANDLVFHPVAPAPPIGATPVRLDGRLLGHIHAPTLAKHTLEDEAAWLAGWLVLREVYADTRRSALTDPLTGAYNRRYLDRPEEQHVLDDEPAIPEQHARLVLQAQRPQRR